LKAVIELEDDIQEDEVVVSYKFFDDFGNLIEDDVDFRSPAIDQGVAVLKMLELLSENPDGVSYEETIN
jgi:hypothetical protein